MAPSSNNDSTSSGPLLSAGLFLATALASQCLQHYLRSNRRGERRLDLEAHDEEISDLDEDSVERQNRRKLQRQRMRRHREQQQKEQQQKLQHAGHVKQHHHHLQRHSDDDDEENASDGYQEDDEPTSSDVQARQLQDDGNQPLGEFPYLRDYYKLRRLEDRLSFDNLHHGPSQQLEAEQAHPHFPSLDNNGANPNANIQLLPPSKQLKFAGLPDATFGSPPRTTKPNHHNNNKPTPPHNHHHRPPRRRRDSAIDREDDYDYLPRNSNWNHFEKYNEDDLQNGVVVARGEGDHHQHHYQAFSNGYNHNHNPVSGYATNDGTNSIATDSVNDDSDRNIAANTNNLPPNNNQQQQHAVGGGTDASSVASSDSSAEPQFVWTDVVRKPKKQYMNNDSAGSDLSHHRAVPPPPQPNHERRVTGDSQVTVPAGNTATTISTATAEHETIRREISNDQKHPPSDPRWLPPRPLASPTSTDLKREVSGSSFGGLSGDGSSEVSESSHPRKSKHKSKGNLSGDDLVSSSHRSARAQYNAKIMPNKVVMVRHGQSMGNINEELYATTPDNAMPLTELGWKQARKAGQHLKANVLAPLESVHFIVSPYARTVETFHGIVSAWCDPDSPEFASIPDREMRLKAWYGRLLEMGLTWHEDPRIREQDFGNYQVPEVVRQAKRDRHRFGVFYYRFPHGESASDVFDRVSTFLDSLWRSFDMNRARNYVLVTHGISIRVLLARYFRYTIHQFNMLSNPRNCEMVSLQHDNMGRLRLQGRYQLNLKERTVATTAMSNGEKTQEQENEKENGKTAGGATSSSVDDTKEKVWEVDEYRFYKRLRILPQHAIKKVNIRISYNDDLTK